MSEYVIKQTQMVKIDALVKALETVMPKWKGNIMVSETAEGLALYGYHGDDRSKLPVGNANYAPKAHIVVPGSGSQQARGKANVVGGSSNDIGFVRSKDGTFSFISSAFDRSQGFNDEWVGKVKGEYGKAVCEHQAIKLKGKSLQGQKWIDSDDTWAFQDFEIAT